MPNPNLFKRTGAQDFSKFLKVMISGPPKSGKTTLLGTVPNILVLDTEPHANNLESIAHLDVPYATITSSNDLRDVAMVLANDSLRQQLAQGTYGIPDIGAVAIDTLDTLQKILKAERLKENRSTQFLRDDWGWLKTEMEKIVELFTALPMHVFFVVHTKTKEMGKGDDAYSIVLPGLEGAISESIAGMVGYSLLSFRKEEIAPDGTMFTKYWLRTEGDSAHDFLGTRTAGRLPTIIEPNMKTIYDTVMANRPAQPAAAAPTATPEATPPTEAEVESFVARADGIVADASAPAVAKETAQNLGQPEQVQTPVETPQAAPEAPAEQPTPPPADKPADDEPISPAAMGHVKRVYDAVEVPFPQDVVEKLTIGNARSIVKYWKAVMEDHKADADQSAAQAEMREILDSHGWMPPADAPAPEPEKKVEPKVDGTVDEVLAYVSALGDGADLDRVQEAYDLELKKGDSARATLIKKLEGFGAKPAEQVQTPAETPETPVTPSAPPADAVPTEEEAVKAVEEGLDATLVGVQDGIPEGSPCEVCKQPIDDMDLAELGLKRFNKVLCVNDYLAETKK